MGCDAAQFSVATTERRFQSTHPRGVRRTLHRAVRRVQGISIHAPTWGATRMCFTLCISSRYFNPRTHVGCDEELNTLIAHYKFQSTHPRGVRLDSQKFLQMDANISIHAPTWGATSTTLPTPFEIKISIHAPTWGATKNRQYQTDTTEDFNPRTHVGCDSLEDTYHLTQVISIHAPTWGATDGKIPNRSMLDISIHAPTWGATHS